MPSHRQGKRTLSGFGAGDSPGATAGGAGAAAWGSGAATSFASASGAMATMPGAAGTGAGAAALLPTSSAGGLAAGTAAAASLGAGATAAPGASAAAALDAGAAGSAVGGWLSERAGAAAAPHTTNVMHRTLETHVNDHKMRITGTRVCALAPAAIQPQQQVCALEGMQAASARKGCAGTRG